jgi:hypothetical protein
LLTGTAVLKVDGIERASVSFSKNDTGAIQFQDIAQYFLPSYEHQVELSINSGSLPFAFQLSVHTPQPSSSPNVPLAFQTSLSKPQLVEGQSSVLHVELKNRAERETGMVVAVIGLPGGLELNFETLENLVKTKKISFYEVKDRQLVLYWRYLEPHKEVAIDLNVLGVIPGDFHAEASRAYLVR